MHKREKETRLFNSANETRNLAESQEFMCSAEHVGQSTAPTPRALAAPPLPFTVARARGHLCSLAGRM